MEDNRTVRTRFAPSPTGFMHVGGIRTALFAWAYARKTGGQFILRIEDTDKQREVEGAMEHILESLEWLGISPDESPAHPGEFGPYKQSDRLEIYRRYAEELISGGHAYVDPYSEEELAGFRQEAKAKKRPFLFRELRPTEIGNTDDWYGKRALRFRTPEIKKSVWHDAVRGELQAGEDALDDFILIKADGYPTYNFAHVIDDHEMKITHVIRGEEFIPSVPKFLSLYMALEFKVPVFVTVPPILNKNGGKKLSKRDGAKDVLAYREEGYLPSAVINFLAGLGWNDGTEQEIFTPEEFVERFTLERIQKSGARFDETKLEWIQWQHAKRLLDEAPQALLDHLQIKSEVDLSKAAKLASTKAGNVAEFKQQLRQFTDYSSPVSEAWLSEVDKSLEPSIARKYLIEASEAIKSLDTYSARAIEDVLRGKMSQLEASPRAFLNLIRWTVSGERVSPGLFEMIEVLGREESERRLAEVIKELE